MMHYLQRHFAFSLKYYTKSSYLNYFGMGSVVNRRNIDIRFLMADAFSQKHSVVIGVRTDT